MTREDRAAFAAMTVERLQQFSAAWNAADLPAVMSFFTEDCVFLPSVEDRPGLAFHGKQSVAEAFARIFARDAGFGSRSGLHVVLGRYGYCEWSLVVEEGDQPMEIRGCDFFEFRGDLICRKDAFRKATTWWVEQG